MNQRKKSDGAIASALIQRPLRYEMADANVIDQYCFLVKEAGNLCVHYEGAGSVRDLWFSLEAVESAKRHIVLSQGSAVTTDAHSLPSVITNDLPPFLLSRGVFSALRSKGKADFTFEWSNEVSTVSVNGTTQMEIVVQGSSLTVPVLHCTGSLYECELWVIDDQTWPIIVKHEEQDGLYWRLLEAA